MAFIKSNLILATMFFALVGGTLAVSATTTDAGPKSGTLSGLDLGSGR